MAPALAIVGNTLVLAYVANDSSNDLKVTTSSDGGSTWTSSVKVGTQSSKMAPALVVFGDACPGVCRQRQQQRPESDHLQRRR